MSKSTVTVIAQHTTYSACLVIMIYY
jgi:hypothetical protein